MQRIHEDLPEKDFEVPATVKEVSICSETGLLARSSCDAVTEYYALSDVPTKRCAGHYVAPPSPTPTPTPEVTQPAEPSEETTPAPDAETTQEPTASPETEPSKNESTSTQTPSETQTDGENGPAASQ